MFYRFEKWCKYRELATVEADSLEEAIKKAEPEFESNFDYGIDIDSVDYQQGETEDEMWDCDFEDCTKEYFKVVNS